MGVHGLGWCLDALPEQASLRYVPPSHSVSPPSARGYFLPSTWKFNKFMGQIQSFG